MPWTVGSQLFAVPNQLWVVVSCHVLGYCGWEHFRFMTWESSSHCRWAVAAIFLLQCSERGTGQETTERETRLGHVPTTARRARGTSSSGRRPLLMCETRRLCGRVRREGSRVIVGGLVENRRVLACVWQGCVVSARGLLGPLSSDCSRCLRMSLEECLLFCLPPPSWRRTNLGSHCPGAGVVVGSDSCQGDQKTAGM